MRFSKQTIFQLILASPIVFGTGNVFAENGDCLVTVRTVHATERSEEHAHKTLRVGAHLADIHSQLEPLPFGKFEVLDVEKKQVAFVEPGAFKLRGLNGKNHLVQVTPQELRGKKVQIGITWEREGQGEILSSQLRVKNQKCVVIGTDEENQQSMIVSIRMNCPEGS